MHGLDMLGDSITPTDATNVASEFTTGGWGGLLSALGRAGQAGVEMYEKQQATDKANADDAAKLAAAVLADSAASMALAQAATSSALVATTPAQSKASAQAKADADNAAAALAVDAQITAGAALSASMTAKRVEAAAAALTDATRRWQADPKNTYLHNLVTAWTSTLAKAQNRDIVKSKPGESMPAPLKQSGSSHALLIGGGAGTVLGAGVGGLLARSPLGAIVGAVLGGAAGATTGYLVASQGPSLPSGPGTKGRGPR